MPDNEDKRKEIPARSGEERPQPSEELTEEQLGKVPGGWNPQPDPPR